MAKEERLSKQLSASGVCSRREADTLIENGWVQVNGSKATLGQKVLPNDKIAITDEGQNWLQKKATVLLNKPVGYVSGQAEDGYQPAIVLVKRHSQEKSDPIKFFPGLLKNLAPAGRLDIDSRGLLILTQDGVIAKTIIGADSKIEKEYIVKTKGEITDDKLNKLRSGLSLDGKKLKPAKIKVLQGNLLNFVLKEGKKRQIRRMCKAVGLDVIFLKRVRIGNIHLGDLKEGSWRFLTNKEKNELLK